MTELIARTSLRAGDLVLRPVAPEHAAGHYEAIIASRHDLLPWMPWAVAPTLTGVQRALAEFTGEWEADREYHFSFFFDQQLVGAGGINRLAPAAGGPAQAEIHYWMHSGFAGRGLATQAGLAMLAFAFDSLLVDEVILLAGEENHRSLRVAEKLGFAYEHTSPDGLAGSNGPFPTRHLRLRRTAIARKGKQPAPD